MLECLPLTTRCSNRPCMTRVCIRQCNVRHPTQCTSFRQCRIQGNVPVYFKTILVGEKMCVVNELCGYGVMLTSQQSIFAIPP